MKKKTIGILLVISLVMIISIGAISAADTNDTLLEDASDTDIATASVALEDNATSLESEDGSDVEINVNDNSDEISDGKVKGDASSNVGEEVLSASDDDLLKSGGNNFYYDKTDKWYEDFEDALSAAESNGGGTIKIWRGTYKYTSDDDDFQYKINTKGTYTIQPYGSDHQVIFDGEEKGWFLHITNEDIHVTISDITFKNGKGNDGPLEVEDGAQLTLYRCIFEGNHASSDGVSYGLGGAIIVDEGSLIANDCRFINNKADRHGGAICIEDSGSVTLNNCYFKGNKKGSDEENDFEDYSIDSGETPVWSFTNCLFVGSGDLHIDVDAPEKSVTITPVVDETINLVVLYKDGKFYDDNTGASGYSTTFTDLDKGTYTVYLMEGSEKRYEYSGNTFTIIEPNFILNDERVFETLSDAVNAISNGGSGEIAVKGGTYTGSSNLNVEINNKEVTIMPKSDWDHVTFSGDSDKVGGQIVCRSNFLTVGSNSKLTIEDITITGYFADSALKFTAGSEGYISDCKFNNIKNPDGYGGNGNPINAQNSNLALYNCTFESNGPTLFKSTIVNIDDCTFTSNSGTQGGAINADSSTTLNVTNSEFNLNEANEGGAIYATNLELYGNEFIGNSANLGGAVYITSQSESLINMTYCVFDTNLGNYRNIYFESLTRKFNFEFNEYDLNLTIRLDDISYGSDSILYGNFDWGSNLNNTYTLLTGIADEENIFGDMVTVVNKKFELNLGVLPGGTHEIVMEGMYTQGDSRDHFWQHDYYSDLYQNEFYLINPAYAKIGIEKAKISLTLEVNDVLIPETPVLNVYADRDLNYTIFIQNKYYQVQVVNGKGSMQLTGLDLGNYTVVGMRDADENYYLIMNFTTFSVGKTYSNFLVVSTNVEYDTLAEAVSNSNREDTIYVKNGTYSQTGIVISDKALEIVALGGAVFDANGRDANFIIVNENAMVDIYGITFRGIHNRNTNYGAIVNHGYLSLDSCNFTDNKITKTSFAGNGGAAIFSDGESLEIDNCNFINNVAPLKASTAAVTSVGHDDVSITDSKFINNTAREGGAVHFKNITQFEAAVISCDFEQNTAVKGSAIYVGDNSRYLTVTTSGFKKNDIKNNLGEKTQLEGGVIYVNANNSDVIFDISLSNFEDNSNSNVDGGVICLDGCYKTSIGSCIFTNNKGKVGSAILIKNPNDKKLSLFIDSSAFINNTATNGAIATSPKVTAFIDECLFANNTGENRNIYSNGFTVAHDSIFDVKDTKLNAPSVQYGESSTITGTADVGTNLYAAANLTVAGVNSIVEIKNNAFAYNAGTLAHGKYYAVLNSIVDNNNNTYLMDSISEIFRVTRGSMEFNVSVVNITYGETLKVVESLPSTATGTIDYQLNGNYYTKDEIESLKLDAGKYTLVAIYDHEDFALSSTIVNFEVYKANPTISVPDVDVKYNDSIVLSIESDVPSIYTIEIEDYRNVVFVNGSRTIVIDKTLNPGNYTIKVTSQERVNYISNSTEANLNVNENLPVFSLRISNTNMDDMETGNVGENDSLVDISNNIQSQPLMTFSSVRYFAVDNAKSDENLANSPDNNLGDEYGEGRFIFQYDEDDDYEYFDTLEDAVDEAVLYGSGIITVRGGTYQVYSIDIEGEVELTIKAYENEEVIFDCGGEYYFMLLTYDTEIYPTGIPPFFEVEQTDGPTVTLENITVINGVATYGGAIDLEAGTLILNNCNFHNNAADEGGAIYIGQSDAEYDATVIAVNTTFINNSASSEGGAIYIADDNLDGQSTSASFMLCTFLDNYQGEDDEKVRNYFAGGNVDEITCQYCIFNANGEIYNFTMDKINQAVYVNGTSNDTFDSVVLLYFDTAPLYAINNNGSSDFSITFEDVMGGNYTVGVMNDHDFNTYIFDVKFEMKVPNFIISEDEVYENLTDAIDAVSENGVIYANMNYYVEEQMGIDISKSFTLKNFRGRDVVFDGNSTTWFFTIAEGCTVAFEGIYFTDGAVKNHASIENYGTLVINNCTFDSFETGEIIHNSGLLNILNSTFTLNFVNNAVVWNDGQLFIDTVEFSSNIVNMSSVVYTNGAAEIISSNFTENYNFANGGAIYNAKSLSVKDTVFTENEGYNGGAVYSEGTLEVINSTFEDNTANGYGGAIYNGNEANIFNSTFTGSSSEMDGGAIYNNNIMTVDNSTFVANSAAGKGGAIYNNKSLVLTKSLFGINYAEECANIYNAGDIQYSENTFDFYDVILVVPDGEYGIPTTITGTLNPEFNMDLQVTLPGFVNHKDATVTISDGVFEYVTDILPKGIYDVVLDEIIYDGYGNIYYGEAITDRLIIRKANVYINLTVDDIVLRNTDQAAPVLKISASKDGLLNIVFNNKILNVNIRGGQATVTLDAVGEGNYTVFAAREGDENHNDAVNTTTFTVSEYVGNFIVNSTGGKYDTLREAIDATSDDDVIYVMEGNYSGGYNFGFVISGKKLSIIPLGDVVFDGESSNNYFMYVHESADVTICDIVITGFNTNAGSGIEYYGTFENHGNLTLDGCTFANNAISGDTTKALIYNEGNLNIVECEFYDHVFSGNIIDSRPQSNLIVNGSTFENNAVNDDLISIDNANSVKIISSVFAENDKIFSSQCSIIRAVECTDVVISSAFYNNTRGKDVISAVANTNLLVDNSIFTGNTMDNIIRAYDNVQSTISECTFTENTVKNVVLSDGEKLSVLESTFSDNTLSGNGALYIVSGNAIVNGSVFSNNKANNYRNIYSVSSNVNITNSVFDALNVDFTVQDIDYGQTETIEGTIDIGTNLNLPVNLDINSKTYSVNVTDNKFTYNAGILNGGDYKVVLNPKDANSNTFVFDKITKMFTVNRIDPGLSISIADITQGEKLKVNTTISKNASANVVYELDGKIYSKKELENLTLAPGDYLVVAMYRGDKNFLSATAMDNVKVHKVAPNITVSDVVINYGDEIKVNVSADVADYYTVFIGNESVSLYVNDNATFTFASENFKSGNYEITVYVFETDDYDEAYAYATLTVNKAVGIFNLTNDTIVQGENATITVEVPLNAYGNITYRVYDKDKKEVYSITQSCLDELVVPNLNPGLYNVTGTYEGDSYYAKESIINYGEIFVRGCVDVIVSVDNITYGENATVTVESNVDGDYLVYVGTEPIVVTVIKGTGNVTVPNLSAGSHAANVTVIDGNYSGFNETAFDVAPKSISVDVSIEDIVFGDNAIAIVNGEVDGEYIIEIDNQNYTVNVVDGKGSSAIDGLAIGDDILASITIANANYSASNTTTFNVFSKYNTPISMDMEIVENNITMTVTVSDKATGLVKFQVIGQEEYVVYSDVIGGVAILEDVLETGDYTVVATYMGNDRFNTNITYEDFTIKGHIKKNTTISARADVVGSRVTITVNVDENATGFVKLTVGGTVANIEVVDGVATLTTVLVPNSYLVGVTYLGDDDYNMNNTMVTFTIVEVSKENTTIDLNITADEDTALIMVDLNENATGLVKLYMLWKETGEEYTMYMDVIDGHVETLTNSIEPGNYTIVATYMGDSVFNTNTTSGDVEIFGHILKDTPITADVVASGTRVTLTVKVDENATGFVQLLFGDNVFNIAVEDGIGKLTTSLPYGSYSLNITYLGDANYNKNSTKLDFTIVEPDKEITPISLDVVTDENYVGMTATVSDAATGLIKFQVIGSTGQYTLYADVINGKAILEDTLPVDNYTVIATYMGDSRFNTNITYEDFTILGHIKVDTPISARADVIGNRVTITVNVDENATGFVKLTVGGTVTNIEVEDGVAKLTTMLVANSYFVDVTYLGDDDFNMNSTKLAFTITEVSKKNTNIALDITADEDTALIVVDLNKATTGLVKLYMLWQETGEEYTMYMDVIDGHVETLTNSIEPGNYTVVATYMGDSVFNTNTTSKDIEIFGHVLKDTPITANVTTNGNRV
ncbi:Ig-like domain repeat protein, partial [Methanobrevibacter sp.]|uniref:Ig-like domain repeat protein n=1 Tax=Methanobrevibacter sp. TaxID=66852 RepID=UPI0026E10F93